MIPSNEARRRRRRNRFHRIIIHHGSRLILIIPAQEIFTFSFQEEGLSPERINSFPLQESEDVCTICQQSSQEEHRILPCNHTFHSGCIGRWFEEKTTCPLCREDFR